MNTKSSTGKFSPGQVEGDELALELTPEQIAEIKSNVENQIWRLNNLYYVVNEHGERVKFKLRPIQEQFLREMWFFNVILKSRQHGFSTLIDIWITDCAIFYSNITAVIIAHTREAAEDIFATKVLYPWENLPAFIKEINPVTKKSTSALQFQNNSRVRVTTSARSGTAQIMHISEYGKISVVYPEKAREIKTGGIPAVHSGGFCFIESTAEGRQGEFYEVCALSQEAKAQGRKLTKKDFKFHFYAWFSKRENALSDEETDDVEIPERLLRYFQRLLNENGIVLTQNQKAWYTREEEKLGFDMKREHPSTAEECFEQSVEGAYFAEQIRLVYHEDRFIDLPYDDSVPVHTFWDLGRSDHTAIWFMQHVGGWWHAIHYYENREKGLEFYAEYLRSLQTGQGWRFGEHYAPHDADHKKLNIGGTSPKEQMESLGIEWEIVPRTPRKIDAINVARPLIKTVKFARDFIPEDQQTIASVDAIGCTLGLSRLQNYRKQWDKTQGCWKDSDPLHDDNSNGADAFLQWAQHIGMVRRQGKKSRARQESRPVEGNVLPFGSRSSGARSDSGRGGRLRSYT